MPVRNEQGSLFGAQKTVLEVELRLARQCKGLQGRT